MAWPDTPMLARLEIAWGADLATDPVTWPWVDETEYWHMPEPVKIKRGWSYRGTQVETSTFTIAVKNVTGRFTRGDVRSPLWPNVRKDTPIRWSVSFDDGATWRIPFGGYIRKLPTRWPGNSAKQALATITANGVLYRLDRGTPPALSAPIRYLARVTPVPAACWPLEDGQLVTAASPLHGGTWLQPYTGTHPSGAVVTYPQWGRGDLAPWLPPVVSRTGSADLTILWAPVAMTGATSWTVDWMWRSGTDAADATIDINPSYLPGGALGWPQLLLLPGFAELQVAVNGEPETTTTLPGLFDSRAHHLRWTVSQAGGNVTWSVYMDGVLVQSDTTAGAMTLPNISTIGLTTGGSGGDAVLGYVTIWAGTPATLANAVAAAHGHTGEPASTRIARIAAEEDVLVVIESGDSVPMGPQHPDPPLVTIRACEAADLGMLMEDDVGLRWRPRASLYNQDIALTIDGANRELGAPFEGPDEEPDLISELTVSRLDGGAVTVARPSPVRLPVAVPPINIAADEELPDQAGWRMRVAADETGYPAVRVRLDTSPHLLPDWLNVQQGSRIQVVNPPEQHTQAPIDQLVIGGTETYRGRRLLSAEMVCVPAAPWMVAEVDGEAPVAADGSTLAADLDPGDSTLSLASTTANGTWVTGDTVSNPVDFPLSLRIGGDLVVVSGISGNTSPQTADISYWAAFRSWPAGTPVDVYLPAIVPL
ncbi:hypothetical protein [Micromonospora sp. NPDC004704]